MKKNGNLSEQIGDGLDVGLVPVKAFVNGTTMQESDFLQAVDNVIIKVHDTNDLGIADQVVDTLMNLQHLSGRSLAKLFWSMNEFWKVKHQEEKTGDTFQDHMMARHEIKEIHLARYMRVWEFTQNNQMPKEIQKRPMKDQIAIANMLSQGFDPSKEQWKKLERAGGNADVLRIIRKIKKKPAKKGSLELKLERNGTINAWRDGKKAFIGFLNVKEEADDLIISDAISRIVGNSGMQRR